MFKEKKLSDQMKVTLSMIAGGTIAIFAEGCAICMLMLGLAVIFAYSMFSWRNKAKANKDINRKAIRVLTILGCMIIMILAGIGFYHRSMYHNKDQRIPVEQVSEETDDTTEEPENVTENVVEESEELSEADTSSVARPARGYCPEDENLEETEENSKTPAKAETTVADTTAEIKVEDNSKELADTEKAVEEAKENGDKVDTIETPNGDITVITKDQEVEEEKDETQKVEIDTDSAEDLVNEGEEPSTNVETETTEDTKDDIVSDDEDIDNMFEATETTEVVTTPADGEVTVEEVTEANNSNNVVTDVEEPAEVKEPVVDEVAKIEVNAVDGYEGYINSTMQFSIEGDDVVLEGLDGIDYSFSNGILSVNTGDSATILTITASNSVSSQTFDVVINGIVG